MLQHILLALLALGLASAARLPAVEPTMLAVPAFPLSSVATADISSQLRASAALPAELRGPSNNVVWPQYVLDGLAMAQACRASGRLAAAQPKRLLTLDVQEGNRTAPFRQAAVPRRFQVIQTTAACNASTPVVPKPARELQLLVQGIPGTSTAGMFLIVVCSAGQDGCIAHHVTAPPPPPTIYFEPIPLAQKPTGPSFDVTSDLLASPQLPAALQGDNSVFEWYNLDASVVISVCKVYKPKPRAPKMLAHTSNRQGTVSVDTTLQVLDVNSPACGPNTPTNTSVPQKELQVLLSSPAGKGPIFTLIVCPQGARRCTAYKVTPSVEGLQSATQDEYLKGLGESALGGSNNKILPRFVTRFGNMCLYPEDNAGGYNGVQLKFSNDMDACNKHTMTFTDNGCVKHTYSGRCLHIQNWGAIDGSKLVLWDNCNCATSGTEPWLAWQARADGTLQHWRSGAFVTPAAPGDYAFMSWNNQFWTAHMGKLIGSWGARCLAPAEAGTANGMGVVLRYEACNFAKSTDAFVLQPDGCVRHIATGRCLHVQSGGNIVPPENDPVVLWNDCSCYGQERLRWTYNEDAAALVHQKSGMVLGALNADGSNPPEGAQAVLRTGFANALRQTNRLKQTFTLGPHQACWVPYLNAAGSEVRILKALDSGPYRCAAHTWVLTKGGCLMHMESGQCAGVRQWDDQVTPYVKEFKKRVELVPCSRCSDRYGYARWRVYGNGGLQETLSKYLACVYDIDWVSSSPRYWKISLDYEAWVAASSYGFALSGMF